MRRVGQVPSVIYYTRTPHSASHGREMESKKNKMKMRRRNGTRNGTRHARSEGNSYLTITDIFYSDHETNDMKRMTIQYAY